MNKFSQLALALLFTSVAAQAAEPIAAPVKSAQAPTAPVSATPKPMPAAQQNTAAVKAAAIPQPAAAAATPQKTAGRSSQQDKMRECNKQATGKKGDERRAFMKTCLSHKA